MLRSCARLEWILTTAILSARGYTLAIVQIHIGLQEVLLLESLLTLGSATVLLGVDELVARVLERLDRLNIISDRGREEIVLIGAVGPSLFLLQAAQLTFLLLLVGRTLFIRGLRLSEPLRLNSVQLFKSSDLSLHSLVLSRGHAPMHLLLLLLLLRHSVIVIVAIG